MSRSNRRSAAAAKAGGTPRTSPRPSWLRLHAEPDAAPPAWLPRFDAGVIALVAVLMGWIVLRVHVVGDYAAESDFYGGYATGARLVQRLAPDPSRYGIVGPVYDAAVALAGLVLRDLFLAGKVVSVLSALAALVCWRRIARQALGPVGASWLVVLLAANPVFFRFACSATTDMLAIALQSACLALAITGAGRGFAFGSGALAALAVLTRYSSLALLPVTVVLLLVRPGDPARARARWIAAFAAGLALVAGPWVAYSVAAGHVPGGSLFRYSDFYLTPGMSRNLQDQMGVLGGDLPPARTGLLEFLRRDPAGLLGRSLANIPEHLRLDAKELLGWPVAALCGAGAALALLRGGWRRSWPFAIPWAGTFLLIAPVFHSERYSLPLAPAYLALAAAAIASPWLALELRRPRVPLKLVGAALLLFASAVGGAAELRRQFASDPTEVVDAGRALRRLAAPGERVMSRKGHIGYYSGAEVVALPRVGTLAELGESARRERARFLYYSWYEAGVRPELAFLLDTTVAVPGLERVFATGRQPAVLYRIEPGFGRGAPDETEAMRQAISRARVLVRMVPDSSAAPHHALLAADALDHQRIAEAIEHAAAAIRLRPRDAATWTLMGDAQRAGGRLDDAQLAYRNALTLDARDPNARLGLGWTQLRQGRRDLAAQTWRPLAGIVTEPATAHAMAELFASVGDETAASAARRAIPPGQAAAPKRP